MSPRPLPTPSSLLPALRTHVWFGSCPEHMQMALVERARLVTVKAGEMLFARGETHDGLYCVVAGALKVGSTDPRDGSLRLTLYLEPYHWFGEIALIDRQPRSQHALADVDSTVLVVPRVQIEPWLDAHPECWRDIARLACGKVRLMLTAMEDAATLPLQQVLARRLLFFATGFGQSTQNEPRRRLRLPQEYLASMLGVSRQTVNKALRTLAREGVLALHYAEIEIIDLPALVQRAGQVDPGLAGRSLPTSATA